MCGCNFSFVPCVLSFTDIHMYKCMCVCMYVCMYYVSGLFSSEYICIHACVVWMLCAVCICARGAAISPVPLSRHRSQCHAYVFAVQMTSIFPANCFPPLLLQIWQITPVFVRVCVCLMFPYLAIRFFALSSHELWNVFQQTVMYVVQTKTISYPFSAPDSYKSFVVLHFFHSPFFSPLSGRKWWIVLTANITKIEGANNTQIAYGAGTDDIANQICEQIVNAPQVMCVCIVCRCEVLCQAYFYTHKTRSWSHTRTIPESI